MIGLLSDSHGRAGTTQAAVRLLIAEGADLLIHLGDIGSEAVIDALVEGVDQRGRLRPGVHIVFGNTDHDAAALGRYAERLGVAVDHPAGRIDVGGRTIAFTHGHLSAEMRAPLDAGVDYLIHGHSHRQRDERIGPTRVINPGALFRAPTHTAALLDPAADRLSFVQVPGRR